MRLPAGQAVGRASSHGLLAGRRDGKPLLTFNAWLARFGDELPVPSN